MAFIDEIGGKELIERINKVFYDKVYEHQYLRQFFLEIPQEIIESQQTDFIVQSFGGPKKYMGREPKDAHLNMYITEQAFDIRESLLIEAFDELSVPQALRDRWLKIDLAFKHAIVKEGHDQVQKRYKSDELLIFDDDQKKAA